MATQVTIKIGDRANVTRVVNRITECSELEQFHWVDIVDVNRSLILHGMYDMKVGDVHILVRPE